MFLLVLAIVLIFLLIQKEARFNMAVKAFRVKDAETVIWRDLYERAHAEREILKLDMDAFKNAMPHLIDSIKKDFTNVKVKTITNMVTVTKETKDTVYVALNEKNEFTYKDDWNEFSLSGNQFSFNITDSIGFLQSTKRHGFLNAKRTDTIEAISYNPKTTLKDVSAIQIHHTPKRVGIGIMLGYGATKDGLSPVVAGGLYYRIF